jgi:hypothetical protein
VLADAIGKAIGVNPVDPAFHNGGHREPPQRKLENHRIGPQQLLLLGNDIRALGALSKACFESSVERQNSPTGGALLSSASNPPSSAWRRDRNLHFMTGLLQMPDGKIF